MDSESALATILTLLSSPPSICVVDFFVDGPSDQCEKCDIMLWSLF